MQPKAQFTADERRRMEAYHARPPGEPNNMPNHTSPPPCSSSSSSPLPDGVSVASASSGRSSAPAGVLPARSRYGREYKRPRPFTPPSAARAKRQTSILANTESAQALDFDEVDQVADEADLDEPVLENEARSDQPADTSLQPEQPDVIQDADANSHVSGAGFCCPFEQCSVNQTRWLALYGLTKHLDQVHVRAGQYPPQPFLAAIGRWVCTKCQALHSTRTTCPREPGNVPPPPIPVSNEPTSARAVLEEIRAYDTCLHHTPRGCEDLLAWFTTALLDKAASTGRLSDIRALYLAPRIVLAHASRGGKKHQGQLKSLVRDRIAEWPIIPSPPYDTRTKTRKARPPAANDDVLTPAKEQMVEQAVRDKALSKVCTLVSSVDSPITVDIPTEMKKLHPEGVCQPVDHIPGQLEFSPSAVEAKLKEFPPGSSAGPSGWRSSHLKELLKAKCKQQFLASLAAFCTRIANGSFSDECMSVITAARLCHLASLLVAFA